jgi:hypothetical protein
MAPGARDAAGDASGGGIWAMVNGKGGAATAPC